MASNQPATETKEISPLTKGGLFSRGSTFLGIGIVSILTMTGCGKSADKPAEGEVKTAETDSKKEEVTLEPLVDASKICGDAQVAGSLKEALASSLMTQAKALATTQAESGNITVNADDIGTAAGKVVVDVQNIQAASDVPVKKDAVTCQASVTMQVPADDISRADAMYASAETSLQQKLEAANVTLNEGAVVDEQFRFVVDPQSATPVAQIIAPPVMLKAVADVMANSSIKSQIDAKAARKAAAEKKARQQAAARKAAAEKKARQQAAARKAAAEKKARQQAAARKAAAEKKARQQAAAKKAAAEKKISKQQSNKSSTQASSNKSEAKPTAPAKPKQPTQKANEKLNVKGADNIEMVIVEEEGTY